MIHVKYMSIISAMRHSAMRHNICVLRHISRINVWMHINHHHIMRYGERIPYLRMISLVKHTLSMCGTPHHPVEGAT